MKSTVRSEFQALWTIIKGLGAIILSLWLVQQSIWLLAVIGGN